jgi:uncharacterized FAD-dependent dehydrogenase
MFMDISESILDTKVILTQPNKRHIGSKNKPDTIYRYKQYIHRQFVTHRIYEQAEEIKEQMEDGKNNKRTNTTVEQPG